MKERINILETYPKFLEFLRRLNRNNYLSGSNFEDARDPIVISVIITKRNRIPASIVPNRILAE